jgi:hypothetical protein
MHIHTLVRKIWVISRTLFEKSKQIFPVNEKLRGLVPNFFLYIPTIGPQTQYSKIG